MAFESLDVALILLYFLATLAIGLASSRKAGRAQSDYFLSGRNTPWLLAGTSMVATTFAADTPLAVTGLVRSGGIQANWIWWSFAIGGMLTVFLFARLWRRSGVSTDLELIELRYGGKPAAILRGAKSLYFGIVLNILIMGWVNLALLRILQVLLPEHSAPALLSLVFACTAIYVMFSGLAGVIATDAFQFAVAMSGSILLAIFAFLAVEERAGSWQAGLSSLPASSLKMLPDLGVFEAVIAFATGIAIQWWAAFYPGAEPGGGGYVAQRMLAARSERDSVLATLWFTLAHYCLRSWPWIIAALSAMILYPVLDSGKYEESYVYLIRDILPSPFKGLLVAAFLGAYMSTISTQLNWGASYFINDFYCRFVNKSASEKHYVLAGRLATIALFALSLLVTLTVLDSIEEAWKIMLEAGAGSGFVLILRWYWWRVNARTELISLLVPAVSVSVFRIILPRWNSLWPDLAVPLPGFPFSFLLITAISVLASLAMALLSAPEQKDKLEKFYRSIRPPGPGWKPFGRQGKLRYQLAGWLGGALLVYALLFALGSAFLLDAENALIWLALALPGLALVWIAVRREFQP